MILYVVQAYHKEEDEKYNRHLYPSYLTSYDMTKGGKNFGLQSGLHDAVKFESAETAKEWKDYAETKFLDRLWEVVPIDTRLLGKVEPLYVVKPVKVISSMKITSVDLMPDGEFQVAGVVKDTRKCTCTHKTKEIREEYCEYDDCEHCDFYK